MAKDSPNSKATPETIKMLVQTLQATAHELQSIGLTTLMMDVDEVVWELQHLNQEKHDISSKTHFLDNTPHKCLSDPVETYPETDEPGLFPTPDEPGLTP